MEVKVSPEDQYLLDKYTWYITSHGYAATRAKQESSLGPYKTLVYLHRAVTKAPKGVEVDHINGDKLDNTRENLRFADRSIQNRNISKQKNNTSGILGVSYSPVKGKWVAFFGQNRKAGITSKEEAINIRRSFELADPNYIGRVA